MTPAPADKVGSHPTREERTMSELPRHPISGELAIAVLPSGRIVWPISGAAGDDDDDDPDKGKGGDDGKGGDGKPAKDFEAEAAKWKALARKHEDRAKANDQAASRLKELEDADKTLVQKLEERAAAAERKAADAEAKALRLEIAADKGLTPAMARRLVGTTAAELEADADDLLKALAGATGGAGGNGTADTGDGKGGGQADDKSRRPTEKLKPGAAPAAEAEDNDPTKLAAQVPRL